MNFHRMNCAKRQLQRFLNGKKARSLFDTFQGLPSFLKQTAQSMHFYLPKARQVTSNTERLYTEMLKMTKAALQINAQPYYLAFFKEMEDYRNVSAKK